MQSHRPVAPSGEAADRETDRGLANAAPLVAACHAHPERAARGAAGRDNTRWPRAGRAGPANLLAVRRGGGRRHGRPSGQAVPIVRLHLHVHQQHGAASGRRYDGGHVQFATLANVLADDVRVSDATADRTVNASLQPIAAQLLLDVQREHGAGVDAERAWH